MRMNVLLFMYKGLVYSQSGSLSLSHSLPKFEIFSTFTIVNHQYYHKFFFCHWPPLLQNRQILQYSCPLYFFLFIILYIQRRKKSNHVASTITVYIYILVLLILLLPITFTFVVSFHAGLKIKDTHTYIHTHIYVAGTFIA